MNARPTVHVRLELLQAVAHRLGWHIQLTSPATVSGARFEASAILDEAAVVTIEGATETDVLDALARCLHSSYGWPELAPHLVAGDED